MRLRFALVFLSAIAGFAQRYLAGVQGDPRPVDFKEEKVLGRDAYILDNGYFRISMLRGGGHIAEVRLLSEDPLKNINPMRVPHYPTIEPFTYDPVKHDGIYGSDPHR